MHELEYFGVITVEFVHHAVEQSQVQILFVRRDRHVTAIGVDNTSVFLVAQVVDRDVAKSEVRLIDPTGTQEETGALNFIDHLFL